MPIAPPADHRNDRVSTTGAWPFEAFVHPATQTMPPLDGLLLLALALRWASFAIAGAVVGAIASRLGDVDLLSPTGNDVASLACGWAVWCLAAALLELVALWSPRSTVHAPSAGLHAFLS